MDEAIAILHGIRSAYEEHHRLIISDEAIDSAVKLSARYVSERFLPDKAIDLIDEASSRVRMYKSNQAKATKEIMTELKEVRSNENMALENGRQDEAQDLLERREDLEAKLEKLRTGWDRANSPVVTSDDIAELVSMWTGVPVMQMAREESQRLLQMEAELKQHIIGQDEAIEMISKSVRRARAGLKDPKRPIGSFIFLGPTGVGKTELAKALAEYLFNDEDALLQIDMTEYGERHTVSRLIGAPPGYVGYDEGGQLTEAVRRRPYRVILFDEIEKAHAEVWNSLMQILEEGRLTDGHGRTVDFNNTVIVMTSNIGTQFARRNAEGLGFRVSGQPTAEERFSEEISEGLKRTFRPEFLNRIDEVVIFHALTRENMLQIVDLQMREIEQRVKEQNLHIVLTDAAKGWLAEKGYDQQFGARPLRRTIQRFVESPLSQRLLQGDLAAGDTLRVDLDSAGDVLTFEKQAAGTPNENEAPAAEQALEPAAQEPAPAPEEATP